ncbi:MAG TPA: serine/threonine-protein kinase, partial [Sphingomicrobium sp.]
YFDELVAIKEYFPSAISDRKDGDTVVPNDSSAEEVHALGLKKFVEEAKLLWNLSKPTRHPNIVSVRSLFEINGTAYMVMDFEDGVPLSDHVKKRKKFSEAELMALIRPIGEGLDRAHRVGVLHRDIKPANILINEDGHPVLIDFGSARFDTADATSTKVTFHTPPYAAIEQYVKTYEQGPWTDIYALGVVLYECVTGTKPAEVLERMHGGLGHPLTEGDWPDFSRPFLRAIDAAMTIRPTDRPQSIPQWLTLFDDEKARFGAEDADDAPTRFAAFESTEIVPVVPTPTLSSSGAAVIKLTEPPTGAGPPVEVPAGEEEEATDKAVADAAAKLKRKKGKPKAEEAGEGAPAAGAETTPAAPKPGRWTAQRTAIAAGLGLVVVAGGAWALWPGGQRTAPTDAVSGAPTSTAAENEALGPLGEAPVAETNAVANTTDNEVAAAAPVDLSRIDILSPALASLAAAARDAGRGSDAGRLGATSARLRSLAAEAKAAAAQPGSEALVKAKVDQMNALARGGASALAQAVRRDAEANARELASATGGESNPTVASYKSALASVRRSAGAASSTASPVQAIAAARSALVASRQLASIHPKVAASLLPAKRLDFAAIAASARSTGAQVVSMGKARKPGLFASSKHRDEYRLRQANATAAQAELAKLEQLSGAIGAVTTSAAADSAISQAKAIYVKLRELQASSAAAMPKGADEPTPAKTQ